MFLCTGIITAVWFSPGTVFTVTAVAVIAALVITDLRIFRSRNNFLSGIALSAAFFLSGMLLYSTREKRISSLENERSVFLCTLSDYPLEKENSTMLKVRLVCRVYKDSCSSLTGSMVIYSRKDSSLMTYLPGDRLIIRCTPLPIRNRKNPYEFNYRLYMENQGIRYYAFTGKGDITFVCSPHKKSLICRSLIIRQGIIDMYREMGITGKRLAVVAAITLGQKNLLDAEQKQDFATAGVIHIMAVSGLHVMIISLFVMNILLFLKRKFNIARIIITLAILWIFAFITGLTPSVMRASLMFTFIWSGYLLKRKLNTMNSLLASAFVLIILRPGVIFETGFLLSYSAVTFILVFYHDLYRSLRFRRKIANRIWQMTVVALVAQAGTLPLTITIFNRFPTYFLLTNLIVVPLASAIVITGCLIPLISPVIPVAKILALIINRLTDLTLLITERTADLPLSSVNNAGMLPVECFLLMMTIFFSGCYLLRRHTMKAVYPLLSLLMLTAYHTYTDLRLNDTGEIIVYSIPGSSSVGIRTGRVLNLYTDSPQIAKEIRRHCSTLRLKLVRHNLTGKPCLLSAGSEKILIGNPRNQVLLDDFNPGIIILTGREADFPYDLLVGGGIRTIVIAADRNDSSFHFTARDRASKVRVYSVKKSGAFIKSI
jgi:competence protein ComEC